jgi:O-antigen ligase
VPLIDTAVEPHLDLPSGTRPARLWRSPAFRLAVAIVPGWVTFALLIFNVGWPTKAIVGFVLMLSIFSPVAGFVTAVAVAPLGRLIAATVSVENFRIGEAIVLSFFVGWLLRGWLDRRGPRVPGRIGWTLIAAVAASVGGLAWRLGRYPGELSWNFDRLVHIYNMVDDHIGFVAAARLIEGVAVTAATVTLFRRRPRLAVVVPAVLAGTGCAAAIAGLLLWYGVAPEAILRQYAVNRYRVTAYVPDANAAGSAFAMLICLALGMALRARDRERPMWLALLAANAVGLWLSASRSAVGVSVLGLAFMASWLVSTRSKSRWIGRAVVGAAIAVAAIASVQLWRVTRDQLTRGTDFRLQFNAASVRMIAAEPLVGVGVGQYDRTSTLFLSPQLAWNYGSENAHNYFLQFAAELGLPGLGLFAAFIGAGLLRAIRALSMNPHDARLLGAATGIAVFLATCVVSHPLLIDEVAFPFWVQLGLLFALAGSTLEVDHRADAGRRPWLLTAATWSAVVYVAGLAAITAGRQDIEPPRSAAVDGFYDWETGDDGERYRWTGEYSSVFVPSDVVRVDIPVRMPTVVRALKPLVVTPSVAGVAAAPIHVSDSWSVIRLDLPYVDPATRFKRIDLRVDRTWRPALYIPGNADLRAVGVQVGECRMFRER